ncbi:GNAT family N-acetyltransferase [Shewanella algae]|uniref:GNAT family N-acetyltransferase n=1 Tax=Shewanella algae TaxID=38313 RepID=UPI001AAD5092|nr:GNAT family N-acetyltransferase [Shewanella algae]MBO2602391.1 GNAT family N-acetyltransferase [Shewanella algae]
MRIRKGTPKDTEALVAFNQAMAQETEGLALDSDTLSQGVSTLLENPAKGFYLVAEIEGEIAGSLMVTFEWSDWRAADYYWIQSVYIKPEHRQKGIYRALYQEVKTLAEKQGGAASFRLYVEQENTRAQQAYQSLGMSQSHYLMYEEKPA